MAAPKKYSPKQIAEAKEIILEGIADGLSLKKLLEINKDIPRRRTVYLWFNENSDYYDEEFLRNYTRARRDSADATADKIEEISEKVLIGELDPNQARVAMDGFKWSAGVKEPKKYGKRIDVTTKDQPINNIDYSQLSTETLKEIANASKSDKS